MIQFNVYNYRLSFRYIMRWTCVNNDMQRYDIFQAVPIWLKISIHSEAYFVYPIKKNIGYCVQ